MCLCVNEVDVTTCSHHPQLLLACELHLRAAAFSPLCLLQNAEQRSDHQAVVHKPEVIGPTGQRGSAVFGPPDLAQGANYFWLPCSDWEAPKTFGGDGDRNLLLLWQLPNQEAAKT